MKRRKSREYALQALFQAEFSGGDPGLDFFWKRYEDEGEEVIAFSNDLIKGTLKHIDEIDKVLAECTEHWGLDRMAAVDRNILRFAAYEIMFRPDIPPAATINEALEIAKKYSTIDSASFINGVLDKLNIRQGRKGEPRKR